MFLFFFFVFLIFCFFVQVDRGMHRGGVAAHHRIRAGSEEWSHPVQAGPLLCSGGHPNEEDLRPGRVPLQSE